MQELDFWEPSDDPGQSSTTSGNNELESESEDEDEHLYIVNEEFNRKSKKKRKKSTRVKRYSSQNQNQNRDSFPSSESSYDLPAPRTTLSYFEYCQHLEDEICQQQDCQKMDSQTTNCIQMPAFRKSRNAEKPSKYSKIAGKFKDGLWKLENSPF